MRLTVLIIFLGFTAISFSQTKAEMIQAAKKDSVVQYPGEGALNKGNCIIIKFTGDPEVFLNELTAFHAQDKKQIERGTQSLKIYETSKPYWVYGRYSVFAWYEKKEGYSHIEIYFKAYANPDNYKMAVAQKSYQGIVNHILKK